MKPPPGADIDSLAGIGPVARSTSLVRLVTTQIEQQILDGVLRDGDQLPTESELGRQFGVSRTVVRESLARLSARGLIEVRNGAGGGITVRAPSVASFSDSLRFLIQAENDGDEHDKVLEVRRLLEIEIAGLAAERHTADDLARLEAVLAENEAARADRERFAALDVAFHTALAAATHNELFVLLMDSLGGVLLPLRRLGYSTPGNPGRALRYHRSILDAVAQRSRSAARDAMRAHLTEAEDTLRVAQAMGAADGQAMGAADSQAMGGASTLDDASAP